MNVNVRLFAILRDRAGVESVRLELPSDATVAMACTNLSERFPALREYLKRAAFAVNQDYVASTTQLHDGDEVAVIPPVSGGSS